MNHATLETARRVRELAPGPETSEAVRHYAAEHPEALESFLAGMLAALDPASALGRMRRQDAKVDRILKESETAEASRPLLSPECGKSSDRETVLRFCRERLGLREDGESAELWRGKYLGTYEDRPDDGEVWVSFRRRPQADVRRQVREAGFWYMGKPTYSWRHRLGAPAP